MMADPVTSLFSELGFATIPSSAPFCDLLGGGHHVPDELGVAAPSWNTEYETARPWQAITPAGVGLELPRFVDGTAFISALAHHVRPDGAWVTVVGGSIGAMAGRLVNNRMTLEPEAAEHQHRRSVVAMATSGLPADQVARLTAELAAAGIFLLAVDGEEPQHDLVASIRRAGAVAHMSALPAMRRLEVIAACANGFGGAPLTIIDGPLGGHLADDSQAPVVGVVKRHKLMRLCRAAQSTVLSLREGQRSPAFRLCPVRGGQRMSIVSWYFKLRSDGGVPLHGTIRVEVPEAFLLASAGRGLAEWIDALSIGLMEHRAFRRSYSREHCSLNPILLLEDRLHAIAGRADHGRIRLMQRLGL